MRLSGGMARAIFAVPGAGDRGGAAQAGRGARRTRGVATWQASPHDPRRNTKTHLLLKPKPADVRSIRP
jgi:hypothetical protein